MRRLNEIRDGGFDGGHARAAIPASGEMAANCGGALTGKFTVGVLE
jgi:hypothetical protein